VSRDSIWSPVAPIRIAGSKRIFLIPVGTVAALIARIMKIGSGLKINSANVILPNENRRACLYRHQIIVARTVPGLPFFLESTAGNQAMDVRMIAQ